MLSVYLDNIIVNEEPSGLTEIEEHLYYSEELSTYFLEVNGNLTFRGSEYTYLRSVFDDSVCNEVEIRIEGDGQVDHVNFNGLIKVADIVWTPDRKLAECEVQDNSLTAKVINNKSIECTLSVGKTKNGLDHTVTQQTDIEISNPTDTSNALNRSGIRIFDAFKSIIAFVSDNELGFVSDYFDYTTNTGTQVYSVIITGASIRQGVTNKPTISFNDLFNDISKLENLAMSFEDGNIRIEPKDYFKKQSSTVSFNNVEGLTQELDVNTLYARVAFGSGTDAGQDNYLQDIRFNGTRSEQYHLAGQCNTDTQLDLKLATLITDTNIIQDVLPVARGGTNNDAYDDDVFILHLDSSNKTVLSLKPASATDYYFNERFVNIKVAPRWLGQIPQSIYAFLGEGYDGIHVGSNLAQDLDCYAPFQTGLQCELESPLPFHDVNSNYVIGVYSFIAGSTGGELVDITQFQWSTITVSITAGVYIAPANGVYSFDCTVTGTSVLGAPLLFGMAKTGTNLMASVKIPIVGSSGGYHVFSGGYTVYLNAGDYVGVLCPFGFLANAGATFTCGDPLGSVWQTYDASSVYAIKNMMNYPIPQDDWDIIKNAPFERVNVDYQSGENNMWLSDITRNVRTGKTEIEMLSKNG